MRMGLRSFLPLPPHLFGLPMLMMRRFVSILSLVPSISFLPRSQGSAPRPSFPLAVSRSLERVSAQARLPHPVCTSLPSCAPLYLFSHPSMDIGLFPFSPFLTVTNSVPPHAPPPHIFKPPICPSIHGSLIAIPPSQFFLFSLFALTRLPESFSIIPVPCTSYFSDSLHPLSFLFVPFYLFLDIQLLTDWDHPCCLSPPFFSSSSFYLVSRPSCS